MAIAKRPVPGKGKGGKMKAMKPQIGKKPKPKPKPINPPYKPSKKK